MSIERRRQTQKDYYYRNREKILERHRLRELKNPGRRRRLHLKERYGITQPDYDAILAEQGGVCAICGTNENELNARGKVKPLSVDHCHRTGRIRGLLCQPCNKGIGNFKDDLTLLSKAIDYLKAKP